MKKEICIKGKLTPHIIAAAALVVFVVLGLASASEPPPAGAEVRPGREGSRAGYDDDVDDFLEQAITAAADELMFYLPYNSLILVDIKVSDKPLAEFIDVRLQGTLRASRKYDRISKIDVFNNTIRQRNNLTGGDSTAAVFKEEGVNVIINGTVASKTADEAVLTLEAVDFASGTIIATASEPFNLENFRILKERGLRNPHAFRGLGSVVRD